MKLQRVEVVGEGVFWFFFCSGCKRLHRFSTGRPAGNANWTFDGDLDKPTFSPSLLIYTSRPRPGLPDDPNYDMKPGDWERHTLCHLFLKNGQIEFLGDCDHPLKGQTVLLGDIPDEDVLMNQATGEPL